MASDSGAQAENQAADYLEAKGYRILARNWRNRFCEIDIVAKRAGRIHFVEVKHRSNPDFGSGFDYITKDKTSRLKLAARSWCGQYDWDGDYQIDIISIDGEEQILTIFSNAVTD